MHYLETAIAIAVQAHAGQVDKAGRPYILHPLRVMAAMTTDEERATAVLHDVIEDTPIEGRDLIDADIPPAVVVAVDVLTKIPGMAYEDYLERVKANPIARQVKLSDLRDNMDLSRLQTVTETDRQRLAKYQRAKLFLQCAD